MADQNIFVRERPFFADKQTSFANLLRTPCLSVAEPMLSKNYSKIHSAPAKSHQIVTDNFLLALNMQLASRNPFLRTTCFDLAIFWQGLLDHSLQNALSPSPSQNFRETTPIRRPQPSAGGASEEQQTTGVLVFGSRKASLLRSFKSLGCCTWSLLLETS